MNHFKAAELCLRVANLCILEAKFETQQFNRSWGKVAEQTELFASLDFAAQDCIAAKMLETAQDIRSIQDRMLEARQNRKIDLEPSVYANEARHAKTAIQKGLKKREYLYVAEDRSQYLDKDYLFGESVSDKFPSAAADIKEAGNCLAAECATACVFHLMRAAEIALRALASDRQIAFANKPLDQQEWGVILDALEKVVTQMRRDAITLWPKPEIKDVQIRFYNEVVQEFRGFNEAWRRHLAHAHKDAMYDRDYAASVMGHVRKFMEKLAEKISESSVTPVYWTSV